MNAPLTRPPGYTAASAQDLFRVESNAAPAFTPAKAVRMLFKHKLIIVCCAAVSTVVVAYGLLALPPTYITTAKVLVKLDEDASPSYFNGIAAARDSVAEQSANRRMENEMELAETWPVAAEVVEKLHLGYDQVYQAPLLRLIRPAGDLYDRLAADILGRTPDPERHGFGETVNLFMKSYSSGSVVSKSSDTNSNIIAFTLQATDPDLARRSLEALLEAYASRANRLRLDAAEKAYAILAPRVERARSELATAQGRLEAFLTDSGSTAFPSRSGQGAASDAPSGSALRETARDVTTPRDITTLAQLKTRLIDMQLQLVELQQGLRGPTERTAALERSIASLREQIGREQRRGARNDAQMVDIDRDVQLKQSDLVEVQRRLSQIKMSIDLGEAQVSGRVVIEPPQRPRSSEWKQRVLIGVAGALGGLFLGLTLAGIREFFDRRLDSGPDAAAYLGLPVLGVFPMIGRRARRGTLDGQRLLQRLETTG